MPNILSQSTIKSLLQKTRSVSSDFSVLFLHTISLIHRHLAVYYSQVAISEFESFESSPIFKIRPGINLMYVYAARETDLVAVR